ncbi:hypothetical protein [Streptomyces microflavus]|uniref:hypothetical protein n=1 Tax=Streptomyces microflavus TaxID=1919 RepID=UPI0033E231F5
MAAGYGATEPESKSATEVTADALTDLASRVDALSGELGLAAASLRRGSEDARTVGYRLADHNGTLQYLAAELKGAAADLVHITTAREPGRCPVEWGACPEHGATLRYIANEAITRCTRPGCARTWTRDASVLPCGEPVTHSVVESTGDHVEFCVGHAVDARARLIGATITALNAREA